MIARRPATCSCGWPPAPSLRRRVCTLRAALASATLGLAYAELDALNHDELAWEARVLQFRGYRERWRRQGVLPMLRRLLNDFGVPKARLLGGAPGAEHAVRAMRATPANACSPTSCTWPNCCSRRASCSTASTR